MKLIIRGVGLAGFGVIIYGFWLLFKPLGLIVGGATLLLFCSALIDIYEGKGQ